jgi:hypothetical protein
MRRCSGGAAAGHRSRGVPVLACGDEHGGRLHRTRSPQRSPIWLPTTPASFTVRSWLSTAAAQRPDEYRDRCQRPNAVRRRDRWAAAASPTTPAGREVTRRRWTLSRPHQAGVRPRLSCGKPRFRSHGAPGWLLGRQCGRAATQPPGSAIRPHVTFGGPKSLSDGQASKHPVQASAPIPRR